MGEMQDEKERTLFLKKSGFEMYRNRMLGSLTLKDFLIMVEGRVGDDELKWCEQFVKHMHEQKVGVSTLVFTFVVFGESGRSS